MCVDPQDLVLDLRGLGGEFAHDTPTGGAVRPVPEAFQLFARTEGILPALETSHAIYEAVRLARTLPEDQFIVINLSGRGDKDCQEVARLIEAP